MTALVEVTLESLGREIKARVAAGDKAVTKGEDHYRAAGIQLKEAKARVKAEGKSFLAFYQTLGLRKDAVSRCIAIADGRKTLSGIRADDAERQAKKAARDRDLISVSHGNSEPATLPSPIVDPDLESLRAENARLIAERDEALAEVAKLKAKLARLEVAKAGAIAGMTTMAAVIHPLARPVVDTKSAIKVAAVNDDQPPQFIRTAYAKYSTP